MSSQNQHFRLFWLGTLGSVATALLLFLPSIRYGLVWDDATVLEQLRSFRQLKDFLVVPDSVPKFYYRPVVFASFWLEQQLSGANAATFHRTNIFLHSLNTGLVAVALWRVFALDPRICVASSWLFATHPVHTEAVAWIAGRSDLLTTLFFLLALVAYAQPTRAIRILAAVAFALALGAKEPAIAAVPLFGLFDLSRRRKPDWLFYGIAFLILATYLALRQINLGTPLGGWERGSGLGEKTVESLRALGWYSLHALIPGLVTPYVPRMPAVSGLELAGGLVLLAGAWVVWRHPRTNLSLLVALFLCTLAPAVAILWRVSASTVLADRYVYLPSLAAVALLSTFLARWTLQRSAIFYLSISGLAAFFFAWKTARYLPTWRDNLAFWSAAAAVAPDVSTPQREIGLALLERRQLAEAEPFFARAVALARLPEEQAMARSNLASLYRQRGDYARALEELEAAVRIAAHPGLYHNLGLTAMMAAEAAQSAGSGRDVLVLVQRAKSALQKALAYEAHPQAARYRELWAPAKTHALLGQVLFSLHDYSGSRFHLERALALDPNGPTAAITRLYLGKLPPEAPAAPAAPASPAEPPASKTGSGTP
ncbi:MAG: membrane protein [Candidatus Binatia bacterium]|nr:MAG: membrane protein [Candidatus Binatia bacterium]